MSKNWQTKTIGELCNLMTGGTPSRSKKEFFENGSINWLVSGDINRRIITECDNRITELGLDNSNAKFLPINSVLIALNGQGKTRGMVAMLKIKATCNQSLVSIYPKDTEEIIPEYIFYFLESKYEELRKLTGDTGNDRRGLNMPILRKIKIPYPPLSEQNRIVSILQETSQNIERVIEMDRANLQNCIDVYNKYLENIFTTNTQGWLESKLSEICEKITDGTHQTPTYYNNGFIFLSSRNVTGGKIDWEKIKYIDEKQHNEMHRRVSPRMNDILLAKNGTTGIAALVDREIDFDIYVSLALLRAKEAVLPQYLLFFINSPLAKTQFNKRLKGIGVPNLHLEEIREVLIRYPKSTTEQKRVIEKITKMRSGVTKLGSIYEQKISLVENLKKSIFVQTFSGNL